MRTATGPGVRAYHHEVEFNPDVDYVNLKLREYHALYPECDYIGTWHKHPLQYQQFSQGDVRTAHAIFRDPSYKIHEIINPIVWINPDGSATIRYYYMNREMAAAGQPFQTLDEMIVQPIDDTHALVQRQRVDQPGAGALSPGVPARIVDEHSRLRQAGYLVHLSNQGDEYYFTLTTPQLDNTTIYLVTPPGYPQSAPSLATCTGSGVTASWSMPSRARCADHADVSANCWTGCASSCAIT